MPARFALDSRGQPRTSGAVAEADETLCQMFKDDEMHYSRGLCRYHERVEGALAKNKIQLGAGTLSMEFRTSLPELVRSMKRVASKSGLVHPCIDYSYQQAADMQVHLYVRGTQYHVTWFLNSRLGNVAKEEWGWNAKVSLGTVTIHKGFSNNRTQEANALVDAWNQEHATEPKQGVHARRGGLSVAAPIADDELLGLSAEDAEALNAELGEDLISEEIQQARERRGHSATGRAGRKAAAGAGSTSAMLGGGSSVLSPPGVRFGLSGSNRGQRGLPGGRAGAGSGFFAGAVTSGRLSRSFGDSPASTGADRRSSRMNRGSEASDRGSMNHTDAGLSGLSATSPDRLRAGAGAGVAAAAPNASQMQWQTPQNRQFGLSSRTGRSVLSDGTNEVGMGGSIFRGVRSGNTKSTTASADATRPMSAQYGTAADDRLLLERIFRDDGAAAASETRSKSFRENAAHRQESKNYFNDSSDDEDEFEGNRKSAASGFYGTSNDSGHGDEMQAAENVFDYEHQEPWGAAGSGAPTMMGRDRSRTPKRGAGRH